MIPYNSDHAQGNLGCLNFAVCKPATPLSNKGGLLFLRRNLNKFYEIFEIVRLQKARSLKLLVSTLIESIINDESM